MKYKAVIFDLFGTLIKNFTVEQHESTLERIAAMFSAPPADFVRLWYASFDMRCTGVLSSPEENVEYVCHKLGITADSNLVADAARIRYELTRNSMTPLPGVLDVLRELKEKGYRTGLISDCSSEVPAIWPSTLFAGLFDISVFSCSVGIKKPDPRIYRMAADKLGVKPEDCLYIGDGSSNELTGAAAAGMNPVLIRHPEEDKPGVHRVDFEGSDWDGKVITSLDGVMELIR